jgi:redox-sensitive bicupin YhaK (pirin superfamily)
MKKLMTIQRSDVPHWVGDGFPVRSVFTYRDLEISPFLLLDYAGPAEFKPTEHIRGVGGHPHRGFETVTIVYSGQVEHRDSSGGGGLIKEGDVQWMTAASGLVHEEMHGKEFAKNGGRFEMVQLWVNLPSRDKMASPRYQGIKNEQIPVATLADDAGFVRVIAGDFDGIKGPAATFSPVNVWDIRLSAGKDLELHVPEGHTASVFVLEGELKFGDQTLKEADLGVFEPTGDRLVLSATKESKLLFLGGQPLNEPIVGHGPFVMNSEAEIHQAFRDFNSGKMGTI